MRLGKVAGVVFGGFFIVAAGLSRAVLAAPAVTQPNALTVAELAKFYAHLAESPDRIREMTEEDIGPVADQVWAEMVAPTIALVLDPAFAGYVADQLAPGRPEINALVQFAQPGFVGRSAIARLPPEERAVVFGMFVDAIAWLRDNGACQIAGVLGLEAPAGIGGALNLSGLRVGQFLTHAGPEYVGRVYTVFASAGLAEVRNAPPPSEVPAGAVMNAAVTAYWTAVIGRVQALANATEILVAMQGGPEADPELMCDLAYLLVSAVEDLEPAHQAAVILDLLSSFTSQNARNPAIFGG